VATERLRQRIAAALADPRRREALRAVLRSPEVEGGVSRSGPGSRIALHAILDHVKEPIITVDAAGVVLAANPAANRVFAATPIELLGESIATLIPSLAPAESKLEELAQRVEDTFVDASPDLFEARKCDGGRFSAEMTVSQADLGGERCFVLCLRDVTGRLNDEQALRDSEARYRALVENAPEAIMVLDVDAGRYIDANENAAKLLKMPRERLLEVGPEAISPAYQGEGLASEGLHRSYVERALKGGRPVFEWIHRDAEGREIPCEVRFIRLPSSQRRLIRASVTDIAARRQADTLAYGERRVLELIAGNAPLERTLHAVTRLVQQLHPDVAAAVMLLENGDEHLRLAAQSGLPDGFAAAIERLSIGPHSGSCAAAASLGRQIVVRDIGSDPLWLVLAPMATQHGILASCSTPIVTANERIHGTLALYFDSVRGPHTEELDLVTRLTQLAGIAIRRKQDEAALRESEARYRALFDNVVDGVFQSTPKGEVISANPALLRILGFDSVEELAALDPSTLWVDPKDRDRFIEELESTGRVRDFEYRLRRRDGRQIVVRTNARSVVEDGRVLYFEGTVTDVTERKAAERALFNEKERAQVTLQSIGDAVITTDAAGRVEYLNPVAEQLTGWERATAAGQPIDEVIVLIEEATGDPVENPVMRCLREMRTVSLGADVALRSRESLFAVQTSAAPILDRAGDVIGAVMVFRDMSQERQLHRKLAYYASHDSLTGLINRREFEERLSAALRAVHAGGESGALLYMDLDQFKVVNDTCGHGAGDLLLRQLADVLRAKIPQGDAFARLGGDEFAVILHSCTVQRAVEIAEQLREAVASFRFAWGDSGLQVGVSIGIVPIEAATASIGTLLAAADVACYVAKDLGRNRIHVYEGGDAAERHQEMQWVARITRALEEQRFELFFQPIAPIGAKSGATQHFELLLRMRDERGELVGPSAFIPAAERYNLMPALDRWAVTHALEHLVHRSGTSGEPYTLAINLSGTTLSDSRFLEYLLAKLTEEALPAGSLCFEITETAAIANLEQVVSFMRALKARGCRFSLDDFGTGLSSLTYLKNLPVDYVKIDGHFVRNVARDPGDEAVVEAIARMARAFNIETIAERVESYEVLKRLGELGIDYAQGFFVAVPRPVAELPVQRIHERLSA
jgi:diguanylate cyclase (GGDEF)-like protein/PAS domain S-box-containing protein